MPNGIMMKVSVEVSVDNLTVIFIQRQAADTKRHDDFFSAS